MGKKPFETLYRVSRYYLDQGYDEKNVKRLVEIFLLQCNPTASIVKWSGTIEYAIKRAQRYTAIYIDSINITESELSKIGCLEGRQIKRLAFTLLCLAKYWNSINPNSDFWVNCKDSEILSMANINTSSKRQAEMYHTLRELGFLKFSKKVDNTNVRVCFADTDDDEPVLKISDFRNLGYQYLKYLGEPYIECKNCGITTKASIGVRGRKNTYCRQCANEISIKQRVNTIMSQKIS